MNNYPDELILAVKPQGLLFLDMDKNDLNYIYFNTVASWGASNNVFVVYIDRGNNDTEKIYFESSQARIIQILVASYCNIMAGKPISEVINDRVTISYGRFESFKTIRK